MRNVAVRKVVIILFWIKKTLSNIKGLKNFLEKLS